MRLLMCLVVGLVVFLPVRGEAGFIKGNDLYTSCQQRSITCQYYIAGVVDAQEWIIPAFNLKQYVCVPQGATTTQLIDILNKYMKKHPEMRHYNAAVLINNALAAAFPCSDQQRSGG